jgi:CRISPR-associated protein Csd1
MTVLASLVRAYDRMADRSGMPPYGYSSEKIAFVIPLAENGMPAGGPVDLRQGKKAEPRPMNVPASFKRPGTKPRAFFLWDNSSYALGVSDSPGKDALLRHRAFQERHRRDLAGSDDPGLLALLRFLEWWMPDRFEELGWPEGMKDQNVVFALDGERRERMIHDRPAARELWVRLLGSGGETEGVCLVTGERSSIARLHPAIKGVWGAQTSGASLVSFNLDAFTSYGHEQGENAPVSDAAAFKYAAALNHFLRAGSPQRIQIGDASTIFWADADDAAIADESEALFGAFLGIDEGKEAAKIRPILEKMRAGRPIAEAAPHLAEGVRFFVLGLAPNAARLSVRFYLEDDFGALIQRFARHAEAMRIDPPPREENPSIWRCLIETAAQRKSENIPPNLAGEWLRAILTGRPYPLTLLASVLMRIRSDKNVNALRVAMLKAVLITREREVVPVSLDPESRDPGYLLGRLFAAYEYLQTQALGASINATIRDKYYGTASATPRAVFPLLQRMATHHLARLRKNHPGRARWIDDQIGRIFELADMHLLTPTLNAQRQAMFAVGYYHQKNDFYRTRDNAPAEAEALSEESSQ